jgi:hypothetical protein
MEKRAELDFSEEFIRELNRECQQQSDHLYNFLKGKFPELTTEERLKYLAVILNDHLEEYQFDTAGERHREDGYSIVKFFPKGPTPKGE